MEETVLGNAQAVSEEIIWLGKILDQRIAGLSQVANTPFYFSEVPPPDPQLATTYGTLVKKYQFGPSERLLLISALAPHISPETFTSKLRDPQFSLKINHPKLGGYFDPTFTTFVPTLQTILYLLAGDDMSAMLYHHILLTSQSALLREQIITLRSVMTSYDDTNMRNYAVALAPEYVEYLLSGKKPRPDFGKNFPAVHITTPFTWEHFVVPNNTRKELDRIMRWHKHGENLMTKTGHVLNGSFTCLFYGPSGSGKTMAAQLLGKSIDTDVFRIDLSMVVSKYIGETEKNLAYLFDRAKNKNWILFFDEADALFGKRTEISDSKDKWANLEMSYLLQRMEEHTGITILATNFRNNIDTAMSRRFQSVIYFSRPDKEQRMLLWRKLMPAPFDYNANIDFERLARYELTGGNITNILKAACLEAEARESLIVESGDLLDAIRREYLKENRTLS